MHVDSTKSPTADLVLSDVLAGLGCTTKKTMTGMYRRHVLKHGEIIFTGNCVDCWEWLKEQFSTSQLVEAGNA